MTELFRQAVKKRTRQRSKGEKLRDAGIERVARQNEAFMVEGLSAIQKLNRERPEWTIDALHPLVTTKPSHPNAWGALLRIAHQMGLIRIVGRKKTMRTSGHARVIPIYRGMPE